MGRAAPCHHPDARPGHRHGRPAALLPPADHLRRGRLRWPFDRTPPDSMAATRAAGGQRGAVLTGLSYLVLVAGALLDPGPVRAELPDLAQDARTVRSGLRPDPAGTRSPARTSRPCSAADHVHLTDRGDRPGHGVDPGRPTRLLVMAAYAFAKIDFPGRDALFWAYLATLMIPEVATVMPLYTMMAQSACATRSGHSCCRPCSARRTRFSCSASTSAAFRPT